MKKACVVPRRNAPTPATCPIWVQRVKWPFENRHGPVLKFRCGVGLKSARFVDKRNPSRYYVLHRSTKRAGAWQMSLFDTQGAVGDMAGTCAEVLNEVLPKHWRLVEVKTTTKALGRSKRTR